MFNIPESEKSEPKEIEEEKRGFCEGVFHGVLDMKDAKIEMIIGIGRVSEDKARHVIVEMNEAWVKWQLVKRSKELKEDENAIIQKIIIVPDLTKQKKEK
ncbi:hypothetical protein E2C01_051314 [Portunus trituberculatus]|uniref:Uncharacterized protein n=1 Tax=Portunus trituberculatus TaxID=210409 RepID=A0A5B7GIC3_PORTR|nr:hypothetical protein [Portunus trituberculatus]